MNETIRLPNSAIQNQAHSGYRALVEQRRPDYRYLDKATLDRHMGEIHDMLFREMATEADREACYEIAKAFTYATPYLERYARIMKRVQIDEAALIRAYKSVDWAALPEKNKNQLRRAAREYNEAVRKSVEDMVKFSNRQTDILHDIEDDKTVDALMGLEASELEVKVSNSIRTYIKPAPELKEDYLMAPETLCHNLALWSKGQVYRTPQKIAKELKELGFQKSGDGRWYVSLVRE